MEAEGLRDVLEGGGCRGVSRRGAGGEVGPGVSGAGLGGGGELARHNVQHLYRCLDRMHDCREKG